MILITPTTPLYNESKRKLPVKHRNVTPGNGQHLEPLHNLIISQVLLRHDLIHVMASICVFLQRITPSERLALPGSKRCQVLLRNDVLVHAVEAALYDAKLHKAAYVDVRHDFEPSLAVNHDPLLDALSRGKRGHEADEEVIADPGPAVGHVAGALVDDAVDVADEVVDAGPGRVARAEEEDVEEEDGVVVEQVADGDFGEVQGDGGLVGDAADV